MEGWKDHSALHDGTALGTRVQDKVFIYWGYLQIITKPGILIFSSEDPVDIEKTL